MEIPVIALWAIGILVFILVTTWLIKRFVPNAQTFYLFSMIKTRRFLPLLDRFSKRKRLLNAFADIGLVLGFGALGIDYLVRKKLNKKWRVAVFIASVIVFFEFFNIAFNFLLSNPFIEQYNFFLSLGFGVMGFSGFLLVSLAAYAEFIVSSTLAGEKTCPGVAPVIPGVSIPNFPITVPLHGWISFVIMLVVHEGMHGILLRKTKKKIKSAGVLLAGIFPIGAFVEPDEKELKTAKHREQLRVYSAGPMANLVFAFLVFIVFFSGVAALAVAQVIEPWEQGIKKEVVEGLEINAVLEDFDFCGKKYPAPAFGELEEGTMLRTVNGLPVLFIADFREAQLANPGSIDLVLEDKNGILVEKHLEPNEVGRYGFVVSEKNFEGKQLPENYTLFLYLSSEFNSFLFWLIILSFLIGVVNFLPMVPFDGGKIAQIILLPYFGFLKMPKEKTEKFITRLFFWIILILLLLNALPIFL